MATGLASGDINSSLDTIFTGTQYIQLHTADPGSAGTTAVAANTTRDSVTWASASGASKATAADAAWTSVSTTETYTHFSVWSAASAGTFHGSGTVTGGGVTADQDFTIPSGSLTMSITGAS